MVGDTLETWFCPLILFPVLAEIRLQCRFVLGNLVPDSAVAHLDHQQSVVVFTDEMLQVSVLLFQFCKFPVQYLFLRNIFSASLNEGVQPLVDDLVAQSTHLDVLHDVRTERIVRRKTLVTDHPDDMIAEG